MNSDNVNNIFQLCESSGLVLMTFPMKTFITTLH